MFLADYFQIGEDNMPETTEKKLRTREAASFLTALGYKTAPATLDKLACVGGGPEYETWGRSRLYTPPRLLAWAHSRSRIKRSTSDPGRPVGKIDPGQPVAA